MAGIMDILLSPAGQFGLTWLGGHQQEQAQNESRQAAEERYAQGLELLGAILPDLYGRSMDAYRGAANDELSRLAGVYSGVLDESRLLGEATTSGYADRAASVMGRYDAGRGGYLGEFDASTGRVLNDLDALAAELNAGYGGQLEYLRGAGEQEQRDIERRSEESISALEADARRRGLRSTSVAYAPRGVLERERADAIGALRERLRNQYLDVTGRGLLARERVGTGRAGIGAELAGTRLGAAQRGSEYGALLESGLTDDFLRAQESAGLRDLGYGGAFGTDLATRASNWALGGIDLNRSLTGAAMDWIYGRSDEGPTGNTALALADLSNRISGQRAQAEAIEDASDQQFTGNVIRGVGNLFSPAFASGFAPE